MSPELREACSLVKRRWRYVMSVPDGKIDDPEVVSMANRMGSEYIDAANRMGKDDSDFVQRFWIRLSHSCFKKTIESGESS